MNSVMEDARNDLMRKARAELAEQYGGATDSPTYTLAVAHTQGIMQVCYSIIDDMLARGILAPGPKWKNGG